MRIRGLSRKLRLSRWVIVCLAVVVALASVGVTYAGMKGPKPPKDDPVVIYDYSDPFTWVATNDDGHLDYHDLYSLTDPVDPGDDGSVGEYDYWGVGDTSSSNDPGSYLPPGAPPAPGDNFPRYTLDVARTTAWIEPDPQYITVLIDNAYPYYYSTVFFTLECPESRQGVITDIVIDEIADDASEPEPDTIPELTVTYSGIYIGQPIPAGGEVMGALHILVKQEAEQNATYKIRLSIYSEGDSRKSGTAYAYGGDYANCFDDFGFKKWGWTNGELGPGFYGVFPLYVGASDCQPSAEKLVGTVTIDYDGSTATVVYNITDTDYTMYVTHLWIGDEPFPRGKNGKYTASPGKYGNIHTTPDSGTSDSYEITGLSGDIYVIAHAGVFWFQ